VLAALGCLGAGFSPDRRQPLPAQPDYACLAKTYVQGGVGNGVLIGPDLVLTCAHSITNEHGELRQNGWVEISGQKVSVDTVYLARPKWDQRPDSGQDWAILKLKLPLGWRYGWLECQSLSNEELHRLEVEFAGYSSNPDESRSEFAEMKAPYRCPGSVLDVGDRILFHNCAMWGGGSGAPLLRRSAEGELRVVALNTAGVNVEGEVLDHGFRSTYSRELANVAVPARNWIPTLQRIPRPEQPNFRSLEINNESEQTLKVRLRYNTLFAEPARVESDWTPIPAGQAVDVLRPQDGCVESTLDLRLEGQSEWRPVALEESSSLTLP
jgi:V8-like Glu-specific endopeptidase